MIHKALTGEAVTHEALSKLNQQLSAAGPGLLAESISRCRTQREVGVLLRALLTDDELKSIATRIRAGIGQVVLQQSNLPAGVVCELLEVSPPTLLRAKRANDQGAFDLLVRLIARSRPAFRSLGKP